MTGIRPSLIAASRRRVSFDPDAADYFARIVAAGSTISEPNKAAVNAFVAGCKADGIWSAIKASCLLAGPDTLAGALVPLVGPAPTNFNFVAGDYNRVTGLKGDGSTKYLDSNRNNNADPQNNHHISSFISEIDTGSGNPVMIGTGSLSGNGRSMIGYARSTGGLYFCRSRSDPSHDSPLFIQSTGFVGLSRNNSSTINVRNPAESNSVALISDAFLSSSIFVFARNMDPKWNGRLSFYSIGESLDLAKLDARITTYMASIT
jgi:hypothetical protein